MKSSISTPPGIQKWTKDRSGCGARVPRALRAAPKRAKAASNPKNVAAGGGAGDVEILFQLLPLRLDFQKLDERRLVFCAVLGRPEPLGDDGGELGIVCGVRKRGRKKGEFFASCLSFSRLGVGRASEPAAGTKNDGGNPLVSPPLLALLLVLQAKSKATNFLLLSPHRSPTSHCAARSRAACWRGTGHHRLCFHRRRRRRRWRRPPLSPLQGRPAARTTALP